MEEGALVSHQEAFEALDVPQGQGDVDEHDDVADHNGGHVVLALAVDLILDAALGAEGHRQVGVVVALHEADESGGTGKKNRTFYFLNPL